MSNYAFFSKAGYIVNPAILFSPYLPVYALGSRKIIIVRDTKTYIDDTDWFWTEEWQAKEREADEDYKKGRFEEFGTIDEVISYLHATKKEKDKKE